MKSKEEILEHINNSLERIDANGDPVVYVKELVKFLRTMHASDAHIIIRDNIVPNKNKRIQHCKNLDMFVYQSFQDLRLECKRSFDHDRSPATNLDVDKAVSKAYGIMTRMLRANMDMEKERFDKLTTAINRIEEHLGLDVTDFREGDENDTTEHENAQRIEKVAPGIGEAGKTE